MSRISNLLRKSEFAAQTAETIEADLSFGAPNVPVEIVEIRPESRIVAYSEPRSPAADRVRFLRLRLNQAWNADTFKKVLITSALPHDGKSTIALNLAVALGEDEKRRVLLIEGDLHRTMVSDTLGMTGRPGVAECLENGADPCSLVLRIEPLGFYFLPAGAAHGNPSELLQSGSLPAMVKALSRHFDWVIVDSPPVNPLTDALSWKECTDAALLLARAGHTPTNAVEEAVNLLGKKTIFAIVLNGVEGLDRRYKQYYKAYGGRNMPGKQALLDKA